MLAGGWYRGPGVTLRSPLAISLSFASAFVLSERAAVALSGALKPPSIPPKRGKNDFADGGHGAGDYQHLRS